ncbi:MAG TPA: transglycosylase SLT domain-containing protein [Thermoanaerobaculia bacterium]|nr:transglycosylase SLT domain-containing protein [Thermoanaerobaculia bacterium]
MILVAVGCTKTAPAPPPPTPTPAAVAAPAPVATTIDEARALRRAGKPELYQQGLHDLAKSADPVVHRRALALLALEQYDAMSATPHPASGERVPKGGEGRWDEVFGALTRAAEANAAAAPFLRLRMIDVEEQRGNFASAAAVASEIIATAPDSSAATVARLRLPALFARAGDMPAAEAAYAQVAAIAIDELTEPDFVAMAKGLAKAGREDLATAIRMRLLTQFPNGRFTEDTYDHVAESLLDRVPYDQAFDIAAKLARNDRYDRFFDLMTRLERRYPNAATTDAFRALRWRSLFNSREYTRLLSETANVKLADPAMVLLRARAAWRDDQPQLFLAGLRQLEKDFPASAQATEAKVLRAKYYVTDALDYDQSIRNLTAAIDAGALGNDAENLWTLAWTLTKAGRSAEALAVMDRYIAAYPDADYTSNSLFWSGKLLERLGRTEERNGRFGQLIEKYPYSYYSYRARQIMNAGPALPPAQTGQTGPAGEPALRPTFPDLQAQVIAANEPRLAVVEELRALDLQREAAREMKLAAAAHPDNLGLAFMLADIYVEGGEPFKANGVLQRRFREFVRHGGANIPPRFWEILFPLNYWENIRTEAERRGVDPYLMASIIRQESGFEPTTVSNAGAVGLMQIMPAEASRIAEKGGLAEVTRETLFDPSVNIAVGAAEYRQKLDLMNGNDVLAIAAYNAGEDAVGRWLSQTPIDDLDTFVESIPYAETRLYVKTVTRNRFEYRRIYAAGSGQVARN